MIDRRGLITCLAVPLTGCGGILDPRGPIGAAERLIMFDSLAIMLAIVVPVIVMTLGFAWWFRASNTRAQYRPDWTFSGRLEFVVWAIPALVVVFVGGIAWISAHELDPAKPIESKVAPIEIQVVSLDWKWLFIYPGERVATVNQLVVPAGVPIHFRLTSATVMNSFFVPQLGSQIYTMAGMTTQLWLQADAPGVFHGQSSHFSGDGFSGMHFRVHALAPAAFARWAAATRGRTPPLDEPAYVRLTRQSLNDRPGVYGGVDLKLFDEIVAQHEPEPSTRGGKNPQISPRTRT